MSRWIVLIALGAWLLVGCSSKSARQDPVPPPPMAKSAAKPTPAPLNTDPKPATRPTVTPDDGKPQAAPAKAERKEPLPSTRPKTVGKGRCADPKLKCRIVYDPKDGTPEWVVREAIRAALTPDESRGFERYLELLVADNKDNDRAIGQVRAYSWHQFRKRAASYLEDPALLTYRLTRLDPPEVGPGVEQIKVFLHSTQRDSPAPMTLKREGGKWLILYNSL